MRISEDTFSHLIAGLYEAGMGEGDWASVVHGMTTAFEGVGGVIFDLDPRTGAISNWIGPGLERGTDDYVRHVKAINPRIPFSLAAPLGHIAWDYRVLSEQEMRRHEFYDWLARTTGVKYFIGTRLFDDVENRTSAFTAIQFTPAHGHATREMIERFAQLRGHMANAWRLARLTQHSHATEQIGALVAASAGCGIILIDGGGRIASVNERAASILRQRDGLALQDGALVARRAAETRRLQSLIESCWRTSTRGLGSAGGAAAVTRHSAKPHYVVRVMPIAARPGPRPPRLPAVVVLLADATLPIEVHPRSLSALYGFSRREADLAIRLSAGVSLRAAAAAADMSYNTARNHLRRLFDKSGAKNQVQLVNLLRSLNDLR